MRATAVAIMLGQELEAFTSGLGPHYLFLYSAVRGLEAQAVFEFGVGRSTETILLALEETQGHLFSCAPKPWETTHPRHTHFPVTSEAARAHVDEHRRIPPLELVLHDGSHDAETVAADLAWVLPRVRPLGLVLVHDSAHSYSGPGVRAGIRAALEAAAEFGVETSRVTLPYAFGLTIIRVETSLYHAPLQLTRTKVGSPHHTEPCRE